MERWPRVVGRQLYWWANRREPAVEVSREGRGRGGVPDMATVRRQSQDSSPGRRGHAFSQKPPDSSIFSGWAARKKPLASRLPQITIIVNDWRSASHVRVPHYPNTPAAKAGKPQPAGGFGELPAAAAARQGRLCRAR